MKAYKIKIQERVLKIGYGSFCKSNSKLKTIKNFGIFYANSKKKAQINALVKFINTDNYFSCWCGESKIKAIELLRIGCRPSVITGDGFEITAN